MSYLEDVLPCELPPTFSKHASTVELTPAKLCGKD